MARGAGDKALAALRARDRAAGVHDLARAGAAALAAVAEAEAIDAEVARVLRVVREHPLRARRQRQRRPEGVLILAVAGRNEYALSPLVAQSFPLHAGAASKVLLAGMDPAAQSAVLRGPLPRHTELTVVDPAALEAELARIAAEGWAEDRGEHSRSVCALAAPVKDPAGRVVATVSMAYLAERHEAMRSAHLGDLVRCCEAIADMDLRPVLSTIAAATLVISGSLDPSTPPEHGRAIAEAIPGARFEVIEGAAHLANVESAHLVTPLLREHFAA